MKSEPDEILYRIIKLKIIVFIILCVICVVLGVGVTAFGVTGGVIEFGITGNGGILISLFFVIFGIALVLYYGYALLRNIKNLVSSEAGLLLDSNGIHNKTALFKPETILWKDIRSIRLHKLYSLTTIMSIVLVDTNKYHNGKNFISRGWGKINTLNYGSPVVISLWYFNINATQLSQYIKNRFENC